MVSPTYPPTYHICHLADPSQQTKDDVADIVIDEAPTPVEIDESPSVNDRKFILYSAALYTASYNVL
jgi:hypothetical protein